jgi:hypothetical protein
MRVVTLLPADEANSINKMRKVIAVFRSGALSAFPGARGSNKRKSRGLNDDY